MSSPRSLVPLSSTSVSGESSLTLLKHTKVSEDKEERKKDGECASAYVFADTHDLL